MGKLFRALLFGLIGAGIVHIAVVLLVPFYSDRNAWSRISAYGDDWQFHSVLETGRPAPCRSPSIHCFRQQPAASI